jgi:hypothetical protein
MSSNGYPIALIEVLFTKSCVIAIPGHQVTPGGSIPAPENSINVTPVPDQPHHFVAAMRTVFNSEKSADYPYFIEMECLASFSTDGTLPPEAELRGVTINGHSVCYGAIREAVSWLTARQPYGQVSLGLSVLRPSEEPKSVTDAKVSPD